MLQEFKTKLEKQLQHDLPGEKAHLMMMPIARDDKLVMPSYKMPAIDSAVLILFYPDAYGHIKFPLIQRPTYNGAHSGQIGLPGGKVEKTDTNIIDTALRETHEEIGVDPGSVEVVGTLTDLHISVSNYVVTPVIGFIDERPEFLLDEQEVVDLIESELYDIIDPAKERKGISMLGIILKFALPISILRKRWYGAPPR